MDVMQHPDISNIDVDWLYRGKKKAKRTSSSSKAHASIAVDTSKQPPSSSCNGEVKTQASTMKAPAPEPATHTARSHGAVTELKTTAAAALSPVTSASSSATAGSSISGTTAHAQQKPSPQQLSPTKSATVTKTPPLAPVPPKSQEAPGANRSLLSKALRPRSSSETRAKSSTVTHQTPPSPSSSSTPTVQAAALSRSSSLNSGDKKAKKTTSLFSVFGRKNKTAPSSPVSAPVNIPHAHGHHHNLQPPPSIASSLESLSPKNEHEHLLGHPLVPIKEGQRVVLNKNPNRQIMPIKELSKVRLRRVTFALDKLPEDPPQQIPSRRPKRGNVLVVDDLVGEPLKLTVGITNESKSESRQYDEKEIKLAKEHQKLMLEEAEKHAQEAHKAAQRIAIEVQSFKNKKSLGHEKDEDEAEENMANAIKGVEIDTDIHLHEQIGAKTEPKPMEDHSEISLEQVYTRCCHLREILPIPATLKQLKGKTSPLQTLKLLNPKPTLIDIYSFSDFIAIVPIKNLIFDNVTMTTQMLKIVLSSLVRSTTIEKLSLRNMPIDEEGWRYLCKFLGRNKSITKLDVSQQKVKSDLPSSQYRVHMDWNLFIDTIVLRGGIQELILNGCKLPVPTFERLIDEALRRSTKRFGCAQTEVNLEQINILINWLTSENSTCEGLDLGYNDLSQPEKLRPLIKKLSHAPSLQAISFNSTNLLNVEDAALLVRSLSKLPNLRFLDLSGLPQIFPGVVPYLSKYLPRFPNLNRIHFDHNELSTKSFSLVGEIIPKCEKLVHVSIVGNSTISYEASASLYASVKASKTLVNLDLDYDLIDEKISSRIAITLMRNMERTLNNTQHDDTNDDILFDGTLIAETASKLLDKMNSNDEDVSKKFLQSKFLEKVKGTYERINDTMDSLMYKRDHGQLTLQEKEDLLRFYFLETSLAKIINIFENLPDDNAHPQTTQTLQVPGTNSNADIDPHQMAIDVNEGKATPIDMSTGRPILLRSVSQQSVHARKQEEEEGEFHRWGFFIQQQRQLLPNDTVPSKDPASPRFVPKLPSGTELRDAVIKAKGIDSITTLIDNVNHDKFDMANIYPSIHEQSANSDDHQPKELNRDHDSMDSADDIQEVDEAYDKLLNDLSRVRSNK